jgi:hypothetical protein
MALPPGLECNRFYQTETANAYNKESMQFLETALLFLLGYAIAQLVCSVYRMLQSSKRRADGGFGQAG